MTSVVASESVTVVDEINTVLKVASEINPYKKRQPRQLLKSKENTNKHKCNKVLRRKLKKYKLRLDGKEDQDVLDVSEILVSSLIIKSPNNSNSNSKVSLKSDSELCDFENLRPKNYLFKMVKRKEHGKIIESFRNSNSEQNVRITITGSPMKHADQEKKQTNAFKLLMDSRNKSIGSNSPGKEKSDDHPNMEEEFEKKSIKAKRQLLLQKMAEAKGSLRNKEIEEYQDRIVKKKMEKRAEMLKSMILKDNKSVIENKESNDIILNKAGDPQIVTKDKVEVMNNNNFNKQLKTLKIVDIFNTIENPKKNCSETKIASKEDQEFLKKLSPSLKKRESMLCYFKKLDKDSLESSPDSENHNLIKVKLQTRNKKRGRKKKLSLKRDTSESCDLIELNEEIDQIAAETIINTNDNSKNEEPIQHRSLVLIDNIAAEKAEVKIERQKRKRISKAISKINDSENNNAGLINETRPKRSVKRPVKYNEDVCLSSSDEELHIFTPKKKKHIESVTSDIKSINSKSNECVHELVKSKPEKKVIKNINLTKKSAKLAPIFANKQIDPAALEAKQKFLQSGVPDKLKKMIHQQKNNSIPDNSFPVIVHVQQSNKIYEENYELVLPLMDINDEIKLLTSGEDAFKKLLQLDNVAYPNHVDINFKKSTQTMLQTIKHLHPKFPVYRTYRYLRGKRKGEFKDCNYIDIDNSIEIMNDVVDVINESPDRLNWTDKYKAMSTNQIIGNFETIKELRKWLVSWTENELKLKSKSKLDSDSSDYYQSDTDSRDSMKTMNNLLIVTGPTGSGKTSSIYAVATELAMKVIEVNASSKRTGKIMLQDLQEATQSYKVNRGTGSIDSSQKTQEKSQCDLSKKIKKRGRPKRPTDTEKATKHSVKSEVSSTSSQSQDISRTDSSLILIDDADIVFEQDDGFTSAIVQLVQSSKRPVILITSSLVCPHLQRFLQYGKILKMYPLSPRMLGTWLDIMCLADSGICWPGLGAKFLNYFKGDIRKTINYLQFYIPAYVHCVTPEEETASQNVDFYKTDIDEENSCMSWVDNYESDGRRNEVVNNITNVETNTIWMNFIEKHSNNSCKYPVQLLDIWWSLPHLLTKTSDISSNINKLNDNPKNKKEVYLELEVVANAIDAISFSDSISHINPDSKANITSDPWYYAEAHSVTERENFDYFLKEYEVNEEICHVMVTGSIAVAQDVLGCDRRMDLSFPDMTSHRERDKVISRHKSLTSYLNASAAMDRRALALDYWPSCRSICRFEKSKNDSNMKRNNRFCHYLKSLNVLCKSNTFDNLCDSLSFNEGTELNITNFNK